LFAFKGFRGGGRREVEMNGFVKRSVVNGALRMILLSALVALITPVPPGAPLAEGNRSHALCVQVCSDVRAICDDYCDTDCLAIFPEDDEARLDCLATCHAGCVEEEQACKPLCKDTTIPGEPSES